MMVSSVDVRSHTGGSVDSFCTASPKGWLIPRRLSAFWVAMRASSSVISRERTAGVTRSCEAGGTRAGSGASGNAAEKSTGTSRGRVAKMEPARAGGSCRETPRRRVGGERPTRPNDSAATGSSSS
eukprot:scaffold70294_cov30-Tisochrysis_lutea.AAC.3